MIRNKHIKLLPVGQLLWYLFGAIAVILFVILSYRHLMNIERINNAAIFWAIIILGSLIGTVVGFALTVPDIYTISWLNKQFKWGEKTILRICIQLVLTITIAIAVSTLLTLLSEFVFGYSDPLTDVLLRHGMIFLAVNILLIAVLDRWMFVKRKKYNKEQTELHTTNFLDLQRYVLDTFAKPAVTVAQGLRFIKSYIFLQQKGHSETIVLHDAIPEEIYEDIIPPFALLIVIENAIKYNATDIHNPLKIDLSYANGYVEVKNNIQTPLSVQPSSGSGQNLLMKCYEQLSDTLPVSENRGDVYVVKLPLIQVGKIGQCPICTKAVSLHPK